MDEISYRQSFPLATQTSALQMNPSSQSMSFFGHELRSSSVITTSHEHSAGAMVPSDVPADSFAPYTEVSLANRVSSYSTSLQGVALSSGSPHSTDHFSGFIKSPSCLTNPNALVKYSSSAESDILCKNLLPSQMDMAYASLDAPFARELAEDRDYKYAMNSTNCTTSQTIPDVNGALPGNFSLGSNAGFNSAVYANNDICIPGNGSVSYGHCVDNFFQETIPEPVFRNTFEPHVVTDDNFNCRTENCYSNQGQGQLYSSREHDIICNGEGHVFLAGQASEVRGTSSFVASGFNEKVFAVKRKSYRSFSSELNSPNLPLAEDNEADFDLPLPLGIGEAGFDSFMSGVPNENNIGRFNGRNDSSCIKYNTGFCPTTENNSDECCSPTAFVLAPRMEQAVRNSEPYIRSYHDSREYDKGCFKTEEVKLDCQRKPRCVSMPTVIPQQSEIPIGTIGNSRQEWPYCQQIVDTSYTRYSDVKFSGLDNNEISFHSPVHFLDVVDFPNSESLRGDIRNPDFDIGNFRNVNDSKTDFRKQQITQTAESMKHGCLATSHILAYLSNDVPEFDIPDDWPDSNNGHEQQHHSPLMFEVNSGFDVSDASVSGKHVCRMDLKEGSHDFAEAKNEQCFSSCDRRNFTDPLNISNNDISSTSKHPGLDNPEGPPCGGKSANDADGNLEANSFTQTFRKRMCEESGRRALARVLQQNKGIEGLDSGLVKSALDHIIKHRPRAACFLTARETFDCCYRRFSEPHKIQGHVTTKDVENHFEASGCHGDKIKRRRKTLRLSSEDVTTTTSIPSPATPSSSSSSSVPATVGGQTFPSTPLVAGITPSSVSTNDNCGNPNVSSSSKPEKRRPSVLPPCRVCCSKASGLHYGVVTCEACNGFFRRSLKRGAIYLCSKEKKCDVRFKKRGECSHCRYQKCLSVGMSKSAVKTGRYSDKTRLAYAIETETHNKANHFLNRFSEVSPMTSETLIIQELQPDQSKCVSEYDLFEKHYKEVRQSSSQTLSAECVAKVMPFCKSATSEAPSAHAPEYGSENGMMKMRAIMLEKCLRQYLKFARSVPGFSILPLSDQTKLVRAAWHEIWILESYRCFSAGVKVINAETSFCREIERIFGQELHDLSYRLSAKLEKLKITADELIFVQMACLTDPSACRLDASVQVSSLHWLVTQCLRAEMEKNHPDEPNAFYEVTSAMADLKAARNQLLLRGNSYQHKLSLSNDTPLLREILTSAPG